MISLSLRSTTHPRLFQQTWVRPSSACYRTFSLVMDRSPGFGSTPSDSFALFRLGFPAPPLSVRLATESKSLTHYTKGTPSPHNGGSDCLYAYGFRVYFTPLAGVLFAFPSRYWFTIGRPRVFSLGGWSPQVQTGFHVPRPTWFSFSLAVRFSDTGLSPAVADFSKSFS